MAKIEITRTELVWPGKYNDDGTRKEVTRVNLPFQIVETINERRAKRQAKKTPKNLSLSIHKAEKGGTFEQGWKNKLVCGDNLLVMGSLLEKFAGKIDLIYIDPPFATGADFSFTAPIGESGEEALKEQSMIEEKAYRDTWGRGRDSWFSMMHQRLVLMRELLSVRGSIYIHVDWSVGHHLRPVLDEVFGEDRSLGEIVWAYGSPSGGRVSGAKLVKAHDLIYIYAREYGRHRYKLVYLPYSGKYINDWFKFTEKDGRKYRKRWRRDGNGQSYFEKQYLDESPGVPLSTVWADIQQAYADPRAYREGVTSEITGFPTQKPEKLPERILEISTELGDLVADFFCGSGTTLAVAEKLGRRWIGCDASRWAIHLTRKRLLGIESCKPFEVLNLGKYERKYWEGVTFAKGSQKDGLQYVPFILKLYGAQPVAGMQHLHGKKGKAVVHIGVVDGPVTIDEINGCVEECLAVKQSELHVLAWEWEMGLANLMVEEAKRRGVKLLLLNIPREVMEQQAVEKGDIRFFEVAHLEVEVRQDLPAASRGAQAGKGWKVAVCLKNFAFPYAGLIPEDVRSKIKKWSDYIDYWAIDWDFRNDIFMNRWVACRTRKERKLPLCSDPHVYEKPGRYSIMVKVVDIFGNDTSQVLDREINPDMERPRQV